MLGADGPWGSVVLLYSLHTNTSEQMWSEQICIVDRKWKQFKVRS
jgi:hypothetical protein